MAQEIKQEVVMEIIQVDPEQLKVPKLGETRYLKETRHTQIWAACVDCGKERWVFMQDTGKPQSPRCRSCSGKRIPKARGERSGNWKGGQTKTERGYILIKLQPGDFFYPMANRQGYVREHRLIVAKKLGRCLHIWELVHHKHTQYPAGSIEDKQDNRDENLQLVTDDRHKQITILENRIKQLEQRVTLLEAENVALTENKIR